MHATFRADVGMHEWFRNLPRATLLAISCTLAWCHCQLIAVAQAPSVNISTPAVRRDVTGKYGAANLPVSPYVNLGFNSNGLSNYQTLVRPMNDEREASRWQSDMVQAGRQGRKDVRGRRDTKTEDTNGAAPGSVRFMHYSHYYGGLR